MPITSRLRNKLIDDMNTRVSAIASKMIGEPSERFSNAAPVAWEYFVSVLVAKRADARRKEAEKEAIKAGIIFDKEKHPELPGTNRIVYNDGLTVITLNVSSGSERVNVDEFIENLLEAGVKPSVIEECKEAATKEIRPAHRFSIDLNVVD